VCVCVCVCVCVRVCVCACVCVLCICTHHTTHTYMHAYVQEGSKVSVDLVPQRFSSDVVPHQHQVFLHIAQATDIYNLVPQRFSSDVVPHEHQV
jgi:hypothetical protein